MAGGTIFGAAIVGFAFSIAGVIVWFIDSGVANTLCLTVANVTACQQAQNTANLALGIGIVAGVLAIILLIFALKD